MKRWGAWMCAMMLLFGAWITGTSSRAEDFDDEDDFFFFDDDDDMEFDDDDEDFNILTDSFTANDFAGEDQIQTYSWGDYLYTLNEDGGAVTLSYKGSDAHVVVPEILDGHPVVGIGEFTFNFREDIVSVELPEGVTSIGNMAFFKCSALESVVIPEGVTVLEQSCFGGCGALGQVDVPDTVETVGDFAFLACSTLSEIQFSANLQKVGMGAFQLCVELKKIVIPEGIEIGENAFTDCASELEIIHVT